MNTPDTSPKGDVTDAEVRANLMTAIQDHGRVIYGEAWKSDANRAKLVRENLVTALNAFAATSTQGADTSGDRVDAERFVKLVSAMLDHESPVAKFLLSQPEPDNIDAVRRLIDKAPTTEPFCRGKNCGSTDGLTHSEECYAEADASIAGLQSSSAEGGKL